jgi:glycine/D-amino acid oxidase-like deaminating enzyme
VASPQFRIRFHAVNLGFSLKDQRFFVPATHQLRYRAGMNRAFFEVAIIGAGFAGIAMARALQAAGIENFRVLEKAESPGGTWRDNTYPGAACDVPSHLYSLSDAPKSNWSRLFPQQPEIQAYLELLAQPLRASGWLQTGFRLARASWDQSDALWRIESDSGQQVWCWPWAACTSRPGRIVRGAMCLPANPSTRRAGGAMST